MPGAAGHGSATLAHRWRGYVAVAVVGGAALTGRTVAQAPSPPVDFWEAQWIGLTDDQKTAKIEGWQRLSEEATWQYLRAFFSEGRDLGGLARAAIEVDGYGPRSLDDAIEEAAVIVVGSVSRVQFDFDPRTIGLNAIISVEAVIKGRPEAPVVVAESGAPMFDIAGEVLGEDATNPVMLEGDRVVLIMSTGEGMHGRYLVARTYGQYRVVNGRVYAIDANEEKGFDGMPVNDFADLLRAKLAK